MYIYSLHATMVITSCLKKTCKTTCFRKQSFWIWRTVSHRLIISYIITQSLNGHKLEIFPFMPDYLRFTSKMLNMKTVIDLSNRYFTQDFLQSTSAIAFNTVYQFMDKSQQFKSYQLTWQRQDVLSKYREENLHVEQKIPTKWEQGSEKHKRRKSINWCFNWNQSKR